MNKRKKPYLFRLSVRQKVTKRLYHLRRVSKRVLTQKLPLKYKKERSLPFLDPWRNTILHKRENRINSPLNLDNVLV